MGFTACLQRGTTFVIYCCLAPPKWGLFVKERICPKESRFVLLPKWDLLLKYRVCSKGENLFLEELSPIEKGMGVGGQKEKWVLL